MAMVWVYAEIGPHGPAETAGELLTKARSLGDTVQAIALGPGATEVAAALGSFGATTVYADDDPAFADSLGRRAAHAVAALAGAHAPAMILFSTSYDARDVAAGVQALTGATLMSNATDVLATDRARTEILGGSKIVEVAMNGPALVLLRPGSVAPESIDGAADPVIAAVDRGAADVRTTLRTRRSSWPAAAGWAVPNPSRCWTNSRPR
jgi:electron transfer flavoprotein alpha subunit